MDTIQILHFSAKLSISVLELVILSSLNTASSVPMDLSLINNTSSVTSGSMWTVLRLKLTMV